MTSHTTAGQGIDRPTRSRLDLKALVGSGEKIGALALPFLVIGLVLNVLSPALFSVGGPPPVLKALSVVFLVPGIVVWIWSVYLILTRVPRHELITTGPYAVVKHPLYLGVAFLVLPWAGFLLDSWLGVVFGLVLYAGSVMFAPEEERALAETFGEAWDEYSANARVTATKALLACGLLSSVMYVGTELFASAIYRGYSYTSQMVSELGAIGAPTRPLWIAMSMLYNPLVLAFAVGVWRAARGRRSVRITAAMLFAYGLVSFAGPFVPMHARGTGTSLTDVLHIACTAGMVVFMLLFVAFGSVTSGKRFRIYSIATIVALVVGGSLAGVAGNAVASGGATPWFGLLERVNIYAEMLWVAMLAVTLLKTNPTEDGAQPSAGVPARGREPAL